MIPVHLNINWVASSHKNATIIYTTNYSINNYN